MAIGRRKPEQQKMWINQHQLPKGQGHPSYSRLNNLLAKDGFDSWAEELCAPSLASKGRPSILPGVYFRMLFKAPEILCAVADRGYHKAELIKRLNRDQGITTYIPERDSSQRRRWHGDKDACREFHANRRRARGNEGKRLSRLRSWLVERSFAFLKCSGNMARMTLRGMDNVAKRYLMHAAGYNLSLVMRHLYRYGTPREMAGLLVCLFWPAGSPLLLVITGFPARDKILPIDGLFRWWLGLFGLDCHSEMPAA